MIRQITEWLFIIVIALAIAIPIRLLIAEPFVVDGSSMSPTFETRHFLIIDRLTFDFRKPRRDEVIVFKYPNNTKLYFIKRVIGLPGETVTISNGEVTISNNTASSTQKHLIEKFIQPSNKSHESTTLTLGKDQYFVMGDNRIDSSDSRAWGPVNEKLIIGRPIIRLLPINKISILPGKYHEE